jgi:uncharacterized protein YndB with AHSA1/START domain
VATTTRLMNASPREVFAVLSDPRSYAYWVLGSKAVRDADSDWPANGSRFHHTVGFGPLRLRDHTSVEEVRSDRYLQLRTKARPMGTARVKLDLVPASEGTEVTMNERAADPATAFVFNPLAHLLVHRRNVRSLERLAELAEGRKPMPREEPGAEDVYAGATVRNPAEHGRLSRIASRKSVVIPAVGLALVAVGALAWAIRRSS